MTASGRFQSAHEPVAVIGMAARMPGAPTLEQLWERLRDGAHLVGEVPAHRWDSAAIYAAEPGRPGSTRSKWGGFLDAIEYFDAEFFGVPAAEAAGMDPQQRILLELSQELFDRAGYEAGELARSRTGVFLGAGGSDYLPNRLELFPAGGQRHWIVHQLASMCAARISDFFDLRGPSSVVDTACSASLVALHQACQSLRAGECDLAVTGGVQLLVDPSYFVGFSQAGVLSPSGICQVFDRKADGMVLGEGAGLLLLKPLSKAIEDGDSILALLLGSAVNNDGRTMGLTTPNPETQQAVVQAAWDDAAVDPGTATYLEAHGTGTLLGDPIEIKAATRVFRGSTDERQFCAVGSIKSNVGHLLRAAGVASVIKVILALRNRMIPPTLHCNEPHPRFRFEESPFYPVTRLTEWKPRAGVRRAGVSSFGFGGTNAHLVVEEFDPAQRGFRPRRLPRPPTRFRRQRFWLGRPTVDSRGDPEPSEDERILEVLTQLRKGGIALEKAREAITV